MNIKNKPLPKFEVPSSYEKYAEGGYLMDVREPEADSFGDRKPTVVSSAAPQPSIPLPSRKVRPRMPNTSFPTSHVRRSRECGGHVRRLAERVT